MRRRLLTVLVGVLLTVVAVSGVLYVQPPRYTVTATALLLPPKVNADGQALNPYLQLGGLTSAVDVLARSLNDPRVHDTIAPPGSSSTYDAQRDFLTAAPLLVVTAEGPDVARAKKTRDEVLRVAPTVLSQLQETVGVPQTSRLTMETIVADSPPEFVYKSVIRTMIVVAVAGLALTLLVAGAVDGWRLRRARTRAAREEAEHVDDAADDDPDGDAEA